MKTAQWVLTLLVMLGLAGMTVAAPYVILPNQQRVEGTAIRALPDGSINLTTSVGIKNFPKGSYLKAVADKPPEFDQAVAALNAKKYDEAIKLFEGIVTRFRLLDWDIAAARELPKALLGKGDAEGAVQAYDRLFLMAPAEKQKSEVVWAHRQAMLQAKQYATLSRHLDAVIAGGSRADAARAQIMRGDILLAQNDVNGAVLDYLRTAILFADVKDPIIQGEAHFKAASVLEQLRDPRAKELYRKVATVYRSSPYAAQAAGKM